MTEPNEMRLVESTDEERAKAYRDDLRPLLEKVAEIAHKAMSKDRMTVSFRIGPDPYGRTILHGIDMQKVL